MQTREIERNEIKGGGFLAVPDGAGPHPAVVVIHEAYGLNDHIKGIAQRFAGAGYVALGVDLFADRIRAVCMARYMAGLLTGSVHRAGSDRLKSALPCMARRDDVDAQRAGATGVCTGGGLAVAWGWS